MQKQIFGAIPSRMIHGLLIVLVMLGSLWPVKSALAQEGDERWQAVNLFGGALALNIPTDWVYQEQSSEFILLSSSNTALQSNEPVPGEIAILMSVRASSSSSSEELLRRDVASISGSSGSRIEVETNTTASGEIARSNVLSLLENGLDVHFWGQVWRAQGLDIMMVAISITPDFPRDLLNGVFDSVRLRDAEAILSSLNDPDRIYVDAGLTGLSGEYSIITPPPYSPTIVGERLVLADNEAFRAVLIRNDLTLPNETPGAGLVILPVPSDFGPQENRSPRALIEFLQAAVDEEDPIRYGQINETSINGWAAAQLPYYAAAGLGVLTVIDAGGDLVQINALAYPGDDDAILSQLGAIIASFEFERLTDMGISDPGGLVRQRLERVVGLNAIEIDIPANWVVEVVGEQLNIASGRLMLNTMNSVDISQPGNLSGAGIGISRILYAEMPEDVQSPVDLYAALLGLFSGTRVEVASPVEETIGGMAAARYDLQTPAGVGFITFIDTGAQYLFITVLAVPEADGDLLRQIVASITVE